MTNKTVKVAITGGAGQIAYSLLFRIANGEMFGSQTNVELHILEVAGALEALKGVHMELKDCAYPLLKNVLISSDANEAFKGVDYAILVGAKPRQKGMERKDLIFENAKIFVEQGKALNQNASKNVTVLVVGNPCNTNCWITMQSAPSIPRENFHAMTRLDQNRAVSFIKEKANVSLKDVEDLTIWGNHSSTQVPDICNAKVNGHSLREVVKDNEWLEGEFLTKLQQRGSEIITARGKSSAASAANAIVDAIKAWQGTKKLFSDCICSDNNPYGIEENLIFSFPCVSSGSGEVEIVPNLEMDSFLKEKLKLTEKELIEERDMVSSLLK